MAALLDGALGRLEEAGVSLEPMTRVCIIGKLASATAAAFASWCEAQLKPRDATGFLLLLGTGWVHTFECAPADAASFLHSLAAEKSVQDVKVIACQEDVRKRYFPHWCSKELSVPRANFADIEPGTFHTLLSDTAIGACYCRPTGPSFERALPATRAPHMLLCQPTLRLSSHGVSLPSHSDAQDG